MLSTRAGSGAVTRSADAAAAALATRLGDQRSGLVSVSAALLADLLQGYQTRRWHETQPADSSYEPSGCDSCSCCPSGCGPSGRCPTDAIGDSICPCTCY